MINTASAGPALQSIRSSCDRCRFHKLKCNVPAESDGPSPCERCTRAKVPCVFGRRRRATRTADSTKNRSSDSNNLSALTPRPASSDANTISPPTPPTTAPATSAGRGPREAVASAAMTHIQTAGITVECEVETNTVFEAPPWEPFAVPLPDFGFENVSDQHNTSMSGCWDWLQQSLGSDDALVFDSDPLRTAISWSPSPPPLVMPEATAKQLRNETLGNKVPGQRLLTLITEMQQCLKLLEAGSWQQPGSLQYLDDYPVGTVLMLSHEFGEVAGSVLGEACAAAMTNALTATPRDIHNAANATRQLSRHDDDSSSSDSGGRTPAGDTATTLLVLGGYMWLVRIYGVVLGHFQTHLGHISCSSDNPNGYGGPTPDLGRIYTAVCTLLAALKGVEEQLGRGGAVARNLVVALLTQEALLGAGELQDGYGGLGGKVNSVKELLREKMGL